MVLIVDFTFAECYSLVTAPKIPESITRMGATFRNCTSLMGIVEIDANPDVYDRCFGGVDFEKQGLSLKGTSTRLEELRGTGR